MTNMSIEELDALNQQRKGEIAQAKAASLERRKEMMKLHLVDKISMIALAKRYNVSRQRIYQILNNQN